jgi:hypothetical protein
MNEVFYGNESQFGIVTGNIRESQSPDEIKSLRKHSKVISCLLRYYYPSII